MNQFTTDEYVLAYHGPLLYEARVSQSPHHPQSFSASFTSVIASASENTNCTEADLMTLHLPLLYTPSVPTVSLRPVTAILPCVHSFSDLQVLLAENWNESNTLLGTTGPHYFIHYKGWKQT